MEKMLGIEFKGKGPWSVGTGYSTATGVLFTPGMNNIKKVDWKAIEKHPDVIARLESKVLVMVKEEKAPKGDDNNGDTPLDLSNGIAELSAPKAKKAVKECLEVETLKAWNETETREGVKKEIEKAIEKLEA